MVDSDNNDNSLWNTQSRVSGIWLVSKRSLHKTTLSHISVCVHLYVITHPIFQMPPIPTTFSAEEGYLQLIMALHLTDLMLYRCCLQRNLSRRALLQPSYRLLEQFTWPELSLQPHVYFLPLSAIYNGRGQSPSPSNCTSLYVICFYLWPFLAELALIDWVEKQGNKIFQAQLSTVNPYLSHPPWLGILWNYIAGNDVVITALDLTLAYGAFKKLAEFGMTSLDVPTALPQILVFLE